MLFANVCAGFISSCYGECGQWCFLGFFGFFSVSCAYGGSEEGTISVKMITDLTWCRLNFFELI